MALHHSNFCLVTPRERALRMLNCTKKLLMALSNYDFRAELM